MLLRTAETSGAGVVSVLEGGYAPQTLAKCCVEHVRVMVDLDGDLAS